MNDKNKKIVTILSIFTIIFTLMGGTLAYWNWSSDIRTGVAFTINKDFSCSADGGQDLNATNIELQPTADCTNSEVALQRTIKVTQNIEKTGLSINLDMWLKVNNIGPGLAASDNFMYAISTVEGSCKKGMDGYVTSGNFKGLTTGDQATLLKNKTYTSSTTDTYYLYIWLDAAETDIATANQSFDLSLGGTCSDAPKPEVPVLDEIGMIPVTIADDGTVTTVAADDPNWYNYDNKEWANMVLVKGEYDEENDDYYPRADYQYTTGKEINQDDILAYYVWIPRYKYRIPQIKCSDIENPSQTEYPECYGAPYTLNIDKEYYIDMIAEHLANWDCPEEGCTGEDLEILLESAEGYADEALETGYWFDYDYNHWFVSDQLNTSQYNGTFNGNNYVQNDSLIIDIAFETVEEDMKLGNAITEYRTHPSFWWDDDSDGILDSGEMISGIWVGKFETTPDKSSTCYTTPNSTNCNNSTQSATILPNEVSLRYQNISNQFYTSNNFSGNTYYSWGYPGDVDAHMMKNRDWGAVTYLSHSEYGINGEIRINNNSEYITGCGALTENGAHTTVCENAYGTVESYPQSTTGNISGIFDMAGGTWEYVMGHYGTTLDSYQESSGFTAMPELKYYDLYSETDFHPDSYTNEFRCTIETCGGHAIIETQAYYNSYRSFVNSVYPWVHRGGYYYNRGGTYYYDGRMFTYDYGDGDNRGSYSWRSVLVPGFGDW